MIRSKVYVWIAGGLVAAAFIALPVYAIAEGLSASSCKDVVKAMDAGKVTLSSAIAAAETKSKGKAVAAYSDFEDGKLDFDVYCLVGDKIMAVEVDGAGKAGDMKEAKSVPAGGEDEGKEKAPPKKPSKGG